MDLRTLLKRDFKIDFPISGSTASSQDSPIVIHQHEPSDHTAVEQGILRCISLARGVEWELVEQRSIEHNGRYLDQITIETKETRDTEIITQLESYYFDITECLDIGISNDDNID